MGDILNLNSPAKYNCKTCTIQKKPKTVKYGTETVFPSTKNLGNSSLKYKGLYVSIVFKAKY